MRKGVRELMTEELKQEAEEWLNKWELCNKCENKVDCISNFSYCKKVVLQAYLASAEPREKRIAELEKENAELKSLKDVADLIRLNNSLVVAMAQLNNNNVALCKENAELKSKNGCETCNKFSDVQLTKARNLLNEFMRISKASDEDFEHDYSELITEAEQFLKDSEVEK